MDIDEQDKATIRNFCEDYQIFNVPDDKYLCLPLAMFDEIPAGAPAGIVDVFKGPVRIQRFKLETQDVEGSTALMVSYESPVMEKYYDYLEGVYGEIDHEYEPTFVLSFDYDGDRDLDALSYQFNRYLPLITATSVISGVYNDDERDGILMGSPPMDAE